MGMEPFEAVQGTEGSQAEESAASQDSPQERTRKIQAAMAFLRVAMAGGARPAAEVESEALAAGHTHTTLATARARLSIRSKRQGNAWVWIPPRPRKKQAVTV